ICGTVFFLCNPLTLPFSILGVIGLATYTHFKRRWWGGPFWNSWVVALLPIMGNLCVGFELEKMLSSPQSLAIIGSVFFSYAIFVLLGYFKDVSADRATKYQTLPVVAGWKNSILVSGLFLVSTIGCDVLLWNSTDNSLKTFSFSLFTSLGLWLFGIFCLFFAHFLMWKSAKEEEAHFSIAYVVRGYVLIHSGESLFLAPSLLWFCFFFYAGFEVFLKARPVPSQI
ncbi:UbiA family prenyltransferase, partial [bacterium]|nr:UbiA family prenyltransferase [bacterium]